MKTLNLKLSKEVKDKLDNKLKENNLTKEEYILKLIEQDVASAIDLGKGFYYNEHLDSLFNFNNEEIPLTITQKNLLLALISNNGEIATQKELISKAWNSGENVSIYVFRKTINEIRSKTYYEFIVNHSNKGYSLNLKK